MTSQLHSSKATSASPPRVKFSIIQLFFDSINILGNDLLAHTSNNYILCATLGLFSLRTPAIYN